MFVRLLLLFTVVPLLELFLLIRIGEVVGVPATIALVLSTGALGAWLARTQGLKTLARVRREWLEGQVPTEALLDGVLILLAGAVLLTPGILTDLAGFSLLTPAGRRVVRRLASGYFRRRAGQVGPQVIVIDHGSGGTQKRP